MTAVRGHQSCGLRVGTFLDYYRGALKFGAGATTPRTTSAIGEKWK